MITDTYPPNVNGAALATELLALELAKKHEVYVIAPSTTFKPQTIKQKNLTIFRVRSLPIVIERTQEFRVSPKPFHDKDIKKIISDVKPDIIHINEPWLMGLNAIKIAKKEGVPVVSTHHFMPENLIHYFHIPPMIEKIVTRSIWKWYAKLCRNFDVVICPSPTAAELISKYSSNVNLKVISNGIDLNVYNTKNDGNYLRRDFNIPDKPVILFVGRLDKEKHIDVLLRAGSILKSSNEFHILIVGQGKEKKPLKNLAVKLGIKSNVTFTGFMAKKDLPNIYRVADIFVMPSIAELQSLVTMEAMASGLPVVAANAVALPHLVHDSKNGFLFNPGDEKSLAEKLQFLLKDKKLRDKMSSESLAIIKEHDIKKVVKIVESTYKNAVDNYLKKK